MTLRGSSAVVIPDGAVAQTSLSELSARCDKELRAGSRLLALFGRPDVGERVVVTAVLLSSEKGLFLLRARARRGEGFPSLTVDHPRAHMFERELWEQTGLLPKGHPWLKPVRFEGARQKRMADYPFFALQGKEVHEVGVGPIHAGVIEPGHFRFMCLGEVVHHLEIQLGYQHRGAEELLLKRKARALTPLVEALVGDSSVAHAWAYCAGIEALCGARLPLEADCVRGVALELERIAMHLAGLAGLASDIAFLQGASTYGRLRTAIINVSMRACGSRFGRGWLRPGGVVRGISPELREDLRATLSAFSRDFEQINDLVLSSRSVAGRLRNVGVVAHAAAREVGLLGLAARASGVELDARTDMPGSPWLAFPVEVKTEQSGDCWGRMRMRMTEVRESIKWVNSVLDSTTLGSLVPELSKLPEHLEGGSLCVSICEGWRGEIVHVFESDKDGGLLHYKVQDPSLQNWFGLALALRGVDISDFPMCNKSFDLSYCGNDL